jgi:hypothetical protein
LKPAHCVPIRSSGHQRFHRYFQRITPELGFHTQRMPPNRSRFPSGGQPPTQVQDPLHKGRVRRRRARQPGSRLYRRTRRSKSGSDACIRGGTYRRWSATVSRADAKPILQGRPKRKLLAGTTPCRWPKAAGGNTPVGSRGTLAGPKPNEDQKRALRYAHRRITKHTLRRARRFCTERAWGAALVSGVKTLR